MSTDRASESAIKRDEIDSVHSLESSAGQLSASICREARMSRDPRFDGKFFVGVLTTGIYCRTVCPAVAPKEQNVRYFDSAVKAAQAGLRPCLRCRPDSAPGSNPWKGTGTTLARAISLIEAGALAGKSSGEPASTVTQLADRLGISSRYLNKLFTEGFGTSPKQYALYRQLLFAKQLLHQTQLPITQVALAAGFNSIRRFNEAFKQILQLTPTQLRKTALTKAAKEQVIDSSTGFGEIDTLGEFVPHYGLTLYQYYRPPLDWASQLAFYRLRAVTGMEWFTPQMSHPQASDAVQIADETYVSAEAKADDNGLEYGRCFAIGKMRGTVQIIHEPKLNRFKLAIALTEDSAVDELQLLVTEVRRILDLDADMQQIEQGLSTLPSLGLMPFSGLRIPGAGSLFEAVCRAILGQQVTVVQATKLLNILVEAYGERFSLNGREYRLFPTPEAIREASLTELKMPGARKLALNALAAFICEHPEASVDDWLSVKGIGPWTIAYAKLRGLGDPNVFLHSDLIVKKHLLALYIKNNKLDETATAAVSYPQLCEQLSQHIAPWGSYLTFQLWHQ
ncbi:DNA-3-methyladenine glycosylase 2 family protein [Shewanella baltica]|uniref:Ada metal-binding domain-containing protein n=1 Tax=Shewanella baltica TaxID=62322 RepID=UPI00217F082C|nr:Ada metal-binding domain-containing protein [Shewanella baltica]MCS6128245.1 DNA-3-methyladenine glycosylase 2 family protein [Shewanella baltica]MCS6137610.1 DNA-3-methyladenine glycosylase 2 family protein [Shewanella baltica]MCS6146320.1 DNA-3-methyladenine glycosylase 2 family protein [Shewanella baltica]MCS6170850.1 DNA-3-methyladenine glycosylase 2 family protein [Shewanella baltica]MCS6188213.1 DNA-3-methyladenine glycosylase 2 family protein [Shewanella baltica]